MTNKLNYGKDVMRFLRNWVKITLMNDSNNKNFSELIEKSSAESSKSEVAQI